jgi:FAD:protein FMN transferase
MTALTASPEATESFECFGSTCSVHVAGRGAFGDASVAAAEAKRRLRAWHRQFSRFEPDSELARVNADLRVAVEVSPVMAALADTVRAIGTLTGGVVDGTLIDEVEHAGYDRHHQGDSVPLEEALSLAPPRRPAGPSARAGWRELRVDRPAGMLARPPGVKIDSGGIAKGLFGDVLALELSEHDSFAIDCGGDIRLGGAARFEREVAVAGPFDGRILRRFRMRDGAVATSGIGKRSWLRPDGRPAHHLIDPATGDPAFTGIVQVTAIAPTGVLAEALSKAALLSGPAGAERWLTRGGVIVYDDGSHRVVEPRSYEALKRHLRGSHAAPRCFPT